MVDSAKKIVDKIASIRVDNKILNKGHNILMVNKILIIAPHPDDETLGCWHIIKA